MLHVFSQEDLTVKAFRGTLSTVAQDDRPWTLCEDYLPSVGVVVETKIDHGLGVVMEQRLFRRDGAWQLPDERGRIFYTPTHWRR